MTYRESMSVVAAILDSILESLSRYEQVRTPIGIFRFERPYKRTWIQKVNYIKNGPSKRVLRSRRTVLFIPDPEVKEFLKE